MLGSVQLTHLHSSMQECGLAPMMRASRPVYRLYALVLFLAVVALDKGPGAGVITCYDRLTAPIRRGNSVGRLSMQSMFAL